MEVGHQKPDLKNKIFQKKIEINIRVMFQCFAITAKNKIANTTLKSELCWEFWCVISIREISRGVSYYFQGVLSKKSAKKQIFSRWVEARRKKIAFALSKCSTTKQINS